ncbi:MAG: hypothetical protein HFJ02_00955 [Bacilli bacterium]|nr:hypothetical protein [Bacilli bacterium]
MDLVMETADLLDYPKEDIENTNILDENYVRMVTYEKINKRNKIID